MSSQTMVMEAEEPLPAFFLGGGGGGWGVLFFVLPFARIIWVYVRAVESLVTRVTSVERDLLPLSAQSDLSLKGKVRLLISYLILL